MFVPNIFSKVDEVKEVTQVDIDMDLLTDD